MKKRYNKRLLFILILFISIGFAYLTRDLSLSGISSIFRNTWDVHLENIEVKEGSVNANEPVIDSNRTSVTFSVELNMPGDFYEFNVDAVNSGTIDAMLDTYTSTNLTDDQQKYLEYTVTYLDGEELGQYQELNSGDTLTYKIRIEYKLDITEEDLPEENQSIEVTFTSNFIQADNNRIKRRAENTLYNVLKNEAESGGLAKKYTGSHQDSMDVSNSTKDIYLWHTNLSGEGAIVRNKFNVIFANHCWQMIRTNDTGGIRLLYNGESVDNKCLETRGTHIGYNSYSNETLNNNYWYGTDYQYDSVNKTFTISGSKEQIKWSDSTYNNIIGKYTCKSTQESNSCETLYLIQSYISNTQAKALKVDSNSEYSQYGTAPYAENIYSPASVGYMYNSIDKSTEIKTRTQEDVMDVLSLNTNYLYADDYTYDSTTKKYKLVNPYQVVSSSEFINLEGKYTIGKRNEDEDNDNLWYIQHVDGSSGYGIKLNNIPDTSYANTIYTYGDEYIDNGNDTYTIVNPNTIQRLDWYTSNSVVKNKYLCVDAQNNTCSRLLYVTGTNKRIITYTSTDLKYTYASSYKYENGKYTLQGDKVTFWNLNETENKEYVTNAHYTCLSTLEECDELKYITYIWGYENIFYFKLNNGEDISDVLNRLLNDKNVNQKDSIMKFAVEKWYEKYLTNYSNYIEDAIYCNNRNLISIGGWNPTGGIISKYLEFESTNYSISLNCQNETDKFSISNDKAKLKHPIALITKGDVDEIRADNTLKSADDFWTISPISFNWSYSSTLYIWYNGGTNSGGYNFHNKGVRPAISLKPGTFYTSGDGSMENPYVVFTQ